MSPRSERKGGCQCSAKLECRDMRAMSVKALETGRGRSPITLRPLILEPIPPSQSGEREKEEKG